MVKSQKLGRIQSQNKNYLEVHSKFFKIALLFPRSTHVGTRQRAFLQTPAPLPLARDVQRVKVNNFFILRLKWLFWSYKVFESAMKIIWAHDTKVMDQSNSFYLSHWTLNLKWMLLRRSYDWIPMIWTSCICVWFKPCVRSVKLYCMDIAWIAKNVNGYLNLKLSLKISFLGIIWYL